jgi:lipopolysaccharide transport system ATP-binding protein
MQPVLEIKNISKKFRIRHESQAYLNIRDSFSSLFGKTGHATSEDFLALNDVSFDIYPGESVGIIGKNGAGKSTLLKILSKITPPSSGKIIARGRVASLLEVGTGFHPELTGRENIFLNGSILGMRKKEIRSKFDAIVDFSGVERFLDTPLKHYSSGMQLRLAFAVAAFLDPEILLIDEVLAVGDAEFQKKCMGKMDEVNKSGRTILFVSHNMAAVQNLCKKGVLLSKGKIESSGEIRHVVEQYLHSELESKSEFILKNTVNNSAGYAEKIEILNRDGNPVKLINMDQPWQVKIHFVLHEKVSSFVAGLGFQTHDGVNLRTTWTSPVTLHEGKYQVVFKEDTIMLGKGKYWLTVGFSSHQAAFYYKENAAYIEISNSVVDVQIFNPDAAGIVVNPMKYELIKKETI